ncbi:MAG TPA: hypothetical protein VFZ21_17060 [Gemmatimonadaceae bacterium]|nr:hypothetical protein [Gemmatimonadaceae bacterium]
MTVARMVKHHRELEARFGPVVFRTIHDRARSLMRELFGGEAPPALTNARRDAWPVVDADVTAEHLVAEYRCAGIRPSTDPAWPETMNTRVAAVFDRYVQQIEQRQKTLEQRAAPAAPPSPAAPPNLEKIVEEVVTRVVARREKLHRADVPATVTVVEPREGEPVNVREVIKQEVAAFHRTMHRGVWTDAEHYQVGQLVTFGGSTWSCQRACHGLEGKPGESDRWLLIVKRGADGRKR